MQKQKIAFDVKRTFLKIPADASNPPPPPHGPGFRMRTNIKWNSLRQNCFIWAEFKLCPRESLINLLFSYPELEMNINWKV